MKNARLWLYNNWLLFLVVILFLILNNLNHIIGFYQGYAHQLSYTAMPANNNGDYCVYLSYVEQGKAGQIMMTNLYNHQKQNNLIFSPHWYLLGQFSRLGHVSTIASYFIFRLILSLLFICLLFYLIKKIFPNKKNYPWILAFLLFANGWGAILNPWLQSFGASASNLWIPESIVFNTLTQSPLLILSQILILLTFILFIKAWETKKVKNVFLASLSYLTLILIHPFDTVIIFLVLGAWSLFILLSQKNKKIIYYYLGLLPSLILGCAYYLWLLQDPVMAQFKEQNVLLSPHFILYLFGFGLIFFLSLLGAFYVIKKKLYQNHYLALMLIWGLLGFIMVYLPLDFNRRLSSGWQVPLIFLSIIFLFYLYKKIPNFWKLSLVLSIFIFATFDTWYLLADSVYKIKQYNSIYFFDKQRLDIYTQIKNIARPDDVLLSRANDAGLLPAFTGHKVYLGNKIQTWQFDKKDAELKELWVKPQNIYPWLVAKNIKYIFASRDFVPEFDNIKWLIQEPYLKTLINNERFILLEVISPA